MPRSDHKEQLSFVYIVYYKCWHANMQVKYVLLVTVQTLTYHRAKGEWQPRNDHPQASVLNERKPQAQCEVSTATLRVLMPGGHRLAPTVPECRWHSFRNDRAGRRDPAGETERKRVISGAIAYAWL